MRFVSLVVLTVSAVYGETPILDGGSTLMLRSRDVQFAMRLAQSAAGAKATAEEASRRSMNPDVKAFAATMTADYTRVRSGLKSLVTPMRITLPDEVPSNELSTLVEVRNARPERLDKRYVKASLKQTIRNIKYFKTEIKSGRNPAIQKFAIETLPVLEDHLEKARSLYSAVEKKT
jgi:putative membrane protein